MKHIKTLLILCFVMILAFSCASVEAGYCGSGDRSTYNPGASSVVFENDFLSKTSAKSANLNESSSSLLSETNTTTRSGFYIGIHFEDIKVSDKLGFEPGADFLIISDDLNQIHIPLLITYDVIEDLDVKAGPSLNYLIDDPAGVKSTTFGLDFGASYGLTDKFSVNAVYNLGLSDISENNFNEIKLNNFLIGLRYKL